MKFSKFRLLSVLTLCLLVTLQACKTKKAIEKPAATADVVKPVTPEEKKTEVTQPATETTPAPVVEKPNYIFANIQFEFNSGILKTNAYPILDKAAAEMKKDPSVKFMLNGHSSAEGTDEHNMALSIERANSVKSYLVNTGVNPDNLAVKGYGESKPISSNTTETGRALNRRVEIKKQN